MSGSEFFFKEDLPYNSIYSVSYFIVLTPGSHYKKRRASLAFTDKIHKYGVATKYLS
jgi:hypothetical protein